MSENQKGTRTKRLGSEALTAATAHCAKVRQRIVQERKDRGLTAARVAAEMGISLSFYTQLVNGSRRIDLVYFLAICRALGVEPRELLK